MLSTMLFLSDANLGNKVHSIILIQGFVLEFFPPERARLGHGPTRNCETASGDFRDYIHALTLAHSHLFHDNSCGI